MRAGVCARAAWLGRSAERRPRQTYIVVVAHSAMEVPNRHLPQPHCALKRARVRMQVTRTGTRRQMHTHAAPHSTRSVGVHERLWARAWDAEAAYLGEGRRPRSAQQRRLKQQCALACALQRGSTAGLVGLRLERRGLTEGVRAVGRHRAVRGMLSLLLQTRGRRAQSPVRTHCGRL